MHVTYISESNYVNPDSESGTSYWIAKGLTASGIKLNPIHLSVPQTLLPPFEEFTFRLKQLWVEKFKRMSLVPNYFERRARYVSTMLKESLRQQNADAILTSLTPLASAFLETKIPIVYWTDSVYAALANFYPHFRFHHPDTAWDAHEITVAALKNAKLLLLSSQWAARHAVEFYGISKKKIKVVPFGANLDVTHRYSDVKTMIQSRSKKKIKLLFIGKDWYRKGGEMVLAVTKALNENGYATELTIIGCIPPSVETLPDYVTCVGFISKKTPQGIAKLKQYYQEAHLFFMPSQAECFGIVFSEANAFGVPCISSCVGGIPEVVIEGRNGMTFSLEATIQDYCDYIINLMHNEALYFSLSLSAFDEYQTRLNWQVASKAAKTLIAEIL